MDTNQPKSNKSLIVGLISGVGGLIIIGVVLVLVLVVFSGGSNIKTVADFEKALKNKDALNCQITYEDQVSEARIIANNGWTKVRTSVKQRNMNADILLVEGDGLYAWGSNNGQEVARKAPVGSAVYAGQIEQYKRTDNFDESSMGKITELSCKGVSDADFEVPKNLEFVVNGDEN
jgi:hypothetical protein